MIVFDLLCQDSGDVFEAWFRSNADYEHQSAKGLVECPLCGSADVAKAPMAPAVPRKGGTELSTVMSDLAKAQAEVLKRSEWVGDQFAAEARAIHVGEAAERAIHGRASGEQVQALSDEGVPIAALPFPVIPSDQLN